MCSRPSNCPACVSRTDLYTPLLIGTYDNFTNGDPSGFLRNINEHLPTARDNRLLFIEGTGHTYQQKHQEGADAILNLTRDWSN